MEDLHLEKVFQFTCQELGIFSDALPNMHRLLLKRMLHTHGNELLQNRRLLENVETGHCVDAPSMLRENLKVLVTRSKVRIE